MSLRRKVLRNQGLLKKDLLRCCGERMLNKPGYDTETEIFYTCPNCGKEKWVKRRTRDEQIY
jgi:hypothetical protein